MPIRKPTWKSANGRTELSNAGLNKKFVRESNERIHSRLVSNGFVFWDRYNLTEPWDFNGYTITFRKLIDNHYYIFFQWNWLDHGNKNPFWEGKMRVAHRADKNRPEKEYQPWLTHQVDGITERDLDNLDKFELLLYKSLKANR